MENLNPTSTSSSSQSSDSEDSLDLPNQRSKKIVIWCGSCGELYYDRLNGSYVFENFNHQPTFFHGFTHEEMLSVLLEEGTVSIVEFFEIVYNLHVYLDSSLMSQIKDKKNRQNLGIKIYNIIKNEGFIGATRIA